MKTLTEKHVHAAVESLERGPYGFAACVAKHPYTDCEPAAHGGVTFIETCECGATRRRVSNGRFGEIGTWEAA